jgi:hypothetical protein
MRQQVFYDAGFAENLKIFSGEPKSAWSGERAIAPFPQFGGAPR